MLTVGDRFENPRSGAFLEVLALPGAGSAVLEVRRGYRPGTGRSVPHVHLDYVERFVVEAGRAAGRLDSAVVALAPGDELRIEPGVTHVNPFSASGHDLVMRQSFDPASAFALSYVETLGHLMRRDAANSQGEIPVLAAFALGHATSPQTFAAGVPRALQRAVLFPLGARLARARGVELHLAG